MASSGDNILFIDQMGSSIFLVVKPNQNMIANLDHSKYNSTIQPLVECLNYSSFKKALMHFESIPISSLKVAYSNPKYNKKYEAISLDVQGDRTEISKENFYKLLGLTPHANSVNPNWISFTSIIRDYSQIGYDSHLFILLTFKKTCLPPI